MTEEQLEQSLRKMRRWAGGLLILMLLLLLVSRFVEVRFSLHWMQYVHAFAEAAVVGGLADWFAVTALFRYPLGVKIPHTAIIPNKKDSIGRGIGKFVENNFLNPETLGPRIRSFDAVRKAEEWLAEPDNSMKVATQITKFIPEFLHGLDDANVQEFIKTNLTATLRNVDLAETGGNFLKTIVENDKDHRLFNELMKLVRQIVEENKPALKKAIADESPWLLKGVMQNQVFDRIMVKVNRVFSEVAADDNHPIRIKFHEQVGSFVYKLKTDEEYRRAAEQLKMEILNNPAVSDYINRLWTDIKEGIIRDTTSERSKIRQRIFRSIYGLSNSLLQEKEVRTKLNNYLYEAATNLIAQNRHYISTVIAETISKWDRNTMVEKLERQVGKDLQFIRINGTIVGGLIGLILHIIGEVLRIF
jgi:uncharacterized membrane-anchored protein YjiN (DUF445 family)